MAPVENTSRTVLEGVPEFDAQSESFSDVRALSAALRYLGEEADPQTLMAVSGEAFRSVVHADRWAVTSAYVSPDPVLAVGARAYGYQPRYVIDASADETWLVLTDTLDGGQPALSSGLAVIHRAEQSTHWFVVRGYDAHERTVLLTGLAPGETAFTPLPSLHGRAGTWTGVVKGLHLAPCLWADRPVFQIGRKLAAPDARALAAETVERAIRLARADPVTVPAEVPQAAGRYVLGLPSFGAWAAKLDALTGQEAFFRRGPTEGTTSAVSVTSANREAADRVRLGRRAAARYLRRSADLFEAEVHDCLLSAAAAYTEIADLADEFFHLFSGRSDRADQDLLRERSARREGVILIREMAALEAAAVAQLEAARKAIGAG